MKVITIIPARMGSSRFPGKPLKKILGIPMIGHCYMRAKMSEFISDVYVATCDKEIDTYIKSIGGKSVMTSDKHDRATDRTAEALLKIEENESTKYDIIIMLQGDEPMVTPEMIENSIKPFNDRSVNVTNLMAKISNKKDFNDPNEVKVVCDNNDDALYFSREPIPSLSKSSNHIFKPRRRHGI